MTAQYSVVTLCSIASKQTNKIMKSNDFVDNKPFEYANNTNKNLKNAFSHFYSNEKFLFFPFRDRTKAKSFYFIHLTRTYVLSVSSSMRKFCIQLKNILS